MRTRLSCALARARPQPPYPKKTLKTSREETSGQNKERCSSAFSFFSFLFFYPVGEYPRPGRGVFEGFSHVVWWG